MARRPHRRRPGRRPQPRPGARPVPARFPPPPGPAPLLAGRRLRDCPQATADRAHRLERSCRGPGLRASDRGSRQSPSLSLRMLDPRLVPRALRAFGDTRADGEAVRTRIGADARLPTRRTLDERLLLRWPGLWPAFARAAQILPPRHGYDARGLRRAALSGWGAWVRGDLGSVPRAVLARLLLRASTRRLIAGMPSAYRGHDGPPRIVADLQRGWVFLDHTPARLRRQRDGLVVPSADTVARPEAASTSTRALARSAGASDA